ncbi:MAG: MBL fold metallo-hydrolase [Candidatus Omnitrophica bacterium]|nr:MBL fold metallo-hydrolase [Candidatus Omnitrophota bacterium]MDD5610013.1 MBL fold metallo-hydrolase [Candidatus Omnitrophota bacterium]
MIFRKIVVGPIQANCYILADELTRCAVIIDPGADVKKINAVLEELNLKPEIVINTHGHFDHIGADGEFGVPVYIHKKDASCLSDSNKNFSAWMGHPLKVKAQEIKFLEDNEDISVGEISLQVLHTPGHTPGGISLALKGHEPKVIFTGDTLFRGSIGRTDMPEASEKVLLDSIRNKILKFTDDTIIYPGHGPESSIGTERKENPYLT